MTDTTPNPVTLADALSAAKAEGRAVRGLTLWQPWASLVACGAKAYETRKWPTKFRGLLLIHAGAVGGEVHLYGGRASRIMRAHGLDLFKLPRGSILALAELEAVYRTEDIAGKQTLDELALGDWGKGRFAWKLRNVNQLALPLPWKGAQGLWSSEGLEESFGI